MELHHLVFPSACSFVSVIVPRGTILFMFHVEQLYKMETLTHCPLCNTTLKGLMYLQACDYLVSGQTFNIEKCPACDFLLTNPRPTIQEIKKYYQSPDYISHTDHKVSFQDVLYQKIKQFMLKRKLKLLKKHTKEDVKMLLDYGCGTGDFVLAAGKSGFNAMGFEPEPKANMKAQEKGAMVFKNERELLSNHTQCYDVITLWHVLEHLHKLQENMQAFNKLLKPGASLVLAVPMANSADAQFYNEYWAALDVPRHLYHFTQSSIEDLCNANGFKIVEKKGLFFDSFYVSLLSEKHKKRKAASVFAMFRGLQSNMKAMRKKTPWSSEVFICKKKSRV